MATEIRDRDLGKEFVTGVGVNIEHALVIQRVERTPCFEGRAFGVKGTIRGSHPIPPDVDYNNVIFAEKDFTEGDFLRRSAVKGAFMYRDGDTRQVHIRLSERRDGARTILIRNFVRHPGNFEPEPQIGSTEESQIVVLRKNKEKDNEKPVWKISGVKKHSKTGEKWAEVTGDNPGAFDALDIALELARLVEEIIPPELIDKIKKETKEQEKITELLD